jgi:predicted nucleic acid-binding protein
VDPAPVVVVDANALLRHLARQVTEEDRRMAAIVEEMLEAAGCEIELWLSEAVLAEVLYILTSARHYAVTRHEAAAGIMNVLQIGNCRMADKASCGAALQLWVEYSGLSFVDCLVAAQSMRREGQAATFDRRLQRTPGLSVWPPFLPAGSQG